MKTSVIPVSAPAWHTVDADGQTIGRLAAKIAHMLRGKHKPTFSPHQLCGDHIILLNIEKLEVSPNKALKKMYYDHTGRPGGFSARTLGKLMMDRPEEVMERAVKGMLPRNRLRPDMLKRLHIIRGTEHKYAPQKPTELKI
ncbi:MAG: large subunit ribosomal protein [Candidatus Peribacteria bacterium]|nr:large subunit ribosomal protein [Candidatus Peribacteria bacterium]